MNIEQLSYQLSVYYSFLQIGKSMAKYTIYNSTNIYMYIRAYPGSEFVVANTLAKWKKLEPNKINLFV